MCSWRKYLSFLLMLLFLLPGCGKKSKTGAIKKIDISITGLDGNGEAENNIRSELLNIKGVQTVSFNYLQNQVAVLFDTTLVTQQEIVNKIRGLNEGRYKILDIKENKEPFQKTTPVKPDPQEDIHDDNEDTYKENA